MKVRKYLVLVICLLIQTVNLLSQEVDSVRTISKSKISFITIFDNNKATKDGYYINGYVVNIAYDKGQALHGKKIKITGKVTIVKGLKHSKPEDPIRQGRHEDTKHILKPVIEILN